jgi:hypothetical protein
MNQLIMSCHFDDRVMFSLPGLLNQHGYYDFSVLVVQRPKKTLDYVIYAMNDINDVLFVFYFLFAFFY